MSRDKPFDLDAARALATSSTLLAGDWIRAAKATLLDACDTLAAWREVTGADSPQALAAELADLRARVRGQPTRGDLINRLASAGAARVEAARGVDKAPASGPEREAACQRFEAADTAERAAREALEAFERATQGGAT